MLAMAGRHHKPIPSIVRESRRNRQGARASRMELGERLIVGPGEPILGERVSSGRRYMATVNVRESAIAHMASRGRLDPTQIAAGERFRKICELAAIGHQRGVDFTEPGRSGAVGDPITDELVRAGRVLAAAVDKLGPVYARILMSIVGEGKLIKDVADRWAATGGIVSGERAEGYITGTLIDAINALVDLWKMEGVGVAKQQEASYGVVRYYKDGRRERVKIKVMDDIRASGPLDFTGPAQQWNVGEFGEVRGEKRRGLDRAAMTTHTSGNVGSLPHKK